MDAHPEVLTSDVIGLRDGNLGQRVHAIVQRRPGSGLTLDELMAYLAERLVRYKTPRSIEFITTPFRDDAGKVRRSALREERIPKTWSTPHRLPH